MEIIKNIIKLWKILSIKRKRDFWLLIALMTISALTEIISIGAVIPFIGVIIKPENILTNEIIYISNILSISFDAEDLRLIISIIFTIIIIITAIIKIYMIKKNSEFSYGIGLELSSEAYKRTLHQNYNVHISRNSSQIISGITKVNSIGFGILLPTLNILSSIIFLTSSLGLLLIIETNITIISATIILTIYTLLNWKVKKELKNNSIIINQGQTKIIQNIQEAMKGIREILLDANQKIYCENYDKIESKVRQAQAKNAFINASPRYIMESLGMIIIIILSYRVILKDGSDFLHFLPILGTFVVAAQKLLPTFQNIYASWININANQETLKETLKFLEQNIEKEENNNEKNLEFNEKIELINVSYKYKSSECSIISDLTLNIRKGSKIGIIGTTGAGKSTIVDIIIGLLKPDTGEILIDNKKLNKKNIKSWHKNIALVPQQIYLNDASIAENIAFGKEKEKIDMQSVKKCAEIAQIDTFIENCKDKYETIVGEQGVRLSGGQRQRIAIARALYKKANILILDEATSALDELTEDAVLSNIYEINKQLTIIMISHRVSTMKNCDQIIQIENGKLLYHGANEKYK